MMEESRRIRLVFEDKDGILNETQKSEGLERCWLLLKPHHRTIDDLTAYIFHAFQLHPSSPHALHLYLDDFLLPPFESTDILKDKDIISVRKKGVALSLEGNNAPNFVQELQTVNKQPVNCGQLLLANEEFEKETGVSQSDEPDDESKEEDEKGESTDESKEQNEEEQLEDGLHLEKSSGGNVTSRKRKASEKLQGSKKKKLRSEVQENLRNHVPKKRLHQDGCHVRKENFHSQENAADLKKKTDANNNRKKAESSNLNMEASSNTKRTDQLQKNDDEVQDASGGTQKVPSRSARRKKAKRRWIREMAKIQKQAASSQSEGFQNWKQTRAKDERKKQNSWKQMPSQGERKKHNSWKQKQARSDEKKDPNEPKGLLHWKPWSGIDASDGKRKEEEPNQNGSVCEPKNHKSGTEDEILPVVIRPGHIRFESPEKDQAVKQSQPPGELFQWNGITSKRQGQKWGKEKLPHSQRKDDGDVNRVHSETLNTPKETLLNVPVDFDKLPFLSCLPEAGDIIGYRLLELSSSWTPELSSYRVGQVSWCNSKSGKLLLVPVSDYPITFRKLGEDGLDMIADNSLYKEDGSLEIDFKTLVDVRIVKSGDGGPAEAAISGANGGPMENSILSTPPASKDKQKSSSAPGNGEIHPGQRRNTPGSENGVDLWEQFSEAISAKKAQLSQENTWGKTSSNKGSWSYRALKGSALGPTMALLRSKNKL